VSGPGVVIGRKGTLGTAFFVPTDYWPHDTTLWVKDFKGNNPRFIYYFLQQLDLGLYDVGSSNPTLNRNHVHALPTSVPDPYEQRAIASVLSSLDDKIDLLHRQNKTLEAMAETLFRQWFVEEASEDWEEVPLKHLVIHLKQPVSPNKNPNLLFHHYSLPAFDCGMHPVCELGSEILSNKFRIEPNTILVSKLNPRFPRIWPVFEIPENSVCSTEFQVIKPLKVEDFSFIFYFLKSQSTSEQLVMAASGTSGSHQRVSPEDILRLSVSVPSNGKIEAFSQTSRHFLRKSAENAIQIRTLEKLRDTLLPKLMSGEMRVQYE
jgi:type I restriction enzyme S subunit